MRGSRLLVFLLAGLALLATPAWAVDPPGEPVFTDGVAAGDATSTSAILWTRVDRRTTVKLEVWPNAGLSGKKAFQRTIKNTSAARDFTVKVDATGLKPATQYWYRFRHEDITSPVGTFKTAPDPNVSADVDFSYTGDSDATRVNGNLFFNNFEVLDQARLDGGDFFAYLGDIIYSDSSLRTGGPATTLAQYREAYRDNRSVPATTNLLSSMGIYPQPDDHEVQNDYDGLTVDPARYANGMRAFREYMPIRETGLLQDSSCAGDPLYRTQKWGKDVEFFILDERSCRSGDVAVTCLGDLGPTLPPAIRSQFPFNLFLTPNPPPGCLSALNDPGRVLLGPVQEAAFKNDLANSTAKFKVVLSQLAIQQFYALPYDRWEGYGAERAEVLNYIRDNGIDNVVFLTTDNHANLVNQVSIDRFLDNQPIADELVTGPIATNTLEVEIVAGFGQIGLFAFGAALAVGQLDCTNLNTYSWGDGSYSASAGTLDVDLRDLNGAAVLNVTNPPNPIPCSKSFGP